MMTKERLLKLYMVVYILPIMVVGWIKPSMTKFFVGQVDSTFLATVDMLSQALVFAVSFASCSRTLCRLIEKWYYGVLILSLFLDLLIAIAGPEQVVFRYIAVTINEYLLLALAGRAMNLLINKTLSGEDLFIFSNKMITGFGVGKFVGAGIATVYPLVDIGFGMWVNFFNGLFCTPLECYLFYCLKKVIEQEQRTDA